jgi:hypothetical protein
MKRNRKGMAKIMKAISAINGGGMWRGEKKISKIENRQLAYQWREIWRQNQRINGIGGVNGVA